MIELLAGPVLLQDSRNKQNVSTRVVSFPGTVGFGFWSMF
jgi:hypothetical protein